MKTEQIQRSVLLVDDKTSQRRVYAQSLGKAGFDVTASTEGKALQLLQKRRFDVVVGDISTRKNSETPLLNQMRNLSANSHVVLIVDKASKAQFDLPHVRCLVRPIKSTDLAKTVTEAVQQDAEQPRTSTIESIDATPFTATSAKNDFGSLLEIAIRGGRAVITKHDAPKAVLISFDEFKTLTGAGTAKLETLSNEFDALLSRMQTPSVRTGMKAAFSASPKELAKTASAAARRRG